MKVRDDKGETINIPAGVREEKITKSRVTTHANLKTDLGPAAMFPCSISLARYHGTNSEPRSAAVTRP